MTRLPVFAAVFALVLQAADAALEADISTSRGVVTVVLDFERTPKAVANFVTLAEGTRAWVDSRSGAVRSAPYYDGLAFHATTPTLAAVGSHDGTGTDGPGYHFQDEFAPGLEQEPYVIAWSSDGPNTNGGRFHLIGNAALPERTGREVVFGRVPVDGGRSVVDGIIAAGAGATTIHSIAIRREGPAADFDEFSVPLPVVAPVAGTLTVVPGTAVLLDALRDPNSVLHVRSSTDLRNWNHVFRSFSGLDDPLPQGPAMIDAADVAARFYHFSSVRYPDAGGSDGFASRKLVVHSPGTGEIVYEFDATGRAGTYTNVPVPGAPLAFRGSFTVRDEVAAEYDAYRFSILIQADGLGGAPLNWIRGGFDEVGPASVTGRHVTGFLDGSMNPVFEDEGSLELDRR